MKKIIMFFIVSATALTVPSALVFSDISGNPIKWFANIATDANILHKDVFPGIDLIFSGNEQRIEATMIVNPGANPGDISLDFTGITNLEVNKQNKAVIQTKDGTVELFPLSFFQEYNGKLYKVEGSYGKEVSNKLGVKVSAYNSSYPLKIKIVANFTSGSGTENIVAAPVITATKTDELVVDHDSGGDVDPGDELKYTVTIDNSGDIATGTNYDDTVDPNTTLNAGSLRTTPIARNDTYNSIGNVGINVPAGSGVLANDNDLDGQSISVVSVDLSSTIGDVSLNLGDGSFTYDPAPGYDGTDSFTYIIEDSDNNQDPATVFISVSDVIWFIDQSVASNGNGKLNSPYKTIGDYNTAALDQAGDNIFLADGSYTNGITLKNNQKLIGDGSSSDLATVTGITEPTFSNTLPTFSGTDPIITNAAANGNGINLAQGNTIRGLTVGNTPSGYGMMGLTVGTFTIQETSVNGTGGTLYIFNGTVGTVQFDELSSEGSPGYGIFLSSVTGTISVDAGNIGGTTSPTQQAVYVSGGSVSFTYPGNITQTNNAAAVTVVNGHTGTLTFQTGTISATNGNGLEFSNANGTYNFNGTTTLNGGDAGIDILNFSSGTFTFSSNTSITDPSGAAYSGAAYNENTSTATVTYNGTITQNNSFNTVSINGKTSNSTTFSGAITSNTGTANGIELTNNSGSTVNFLGGGLAITTTSGIGFNATGGGTINVSGAGNSINATDGVAIDFDGVALGMTFASVSSNSSSSAGIQLDNITGSLTMNGGSITSATGTAFDVGGVANNSGGSATVIYAGNITNTAGNCVLIQELAGGSYTLSGNISHSASAVGIQVSEINNGTAATVTFSGTSKTLSPGGGGNIAVQLTDNPNGTINFTGGGLAITTTSGTGFNATGGGTVNVTGSVNTINTTTGTGINITSTNIGGSGVTFQSVSVNGANNGIILNNTGTGDFTVTGSGTTDGSGGTIQNIVDRGIELISAQDVSISNMNLTNAATTQDVAPNTLTCTDLSNGDNTGCNAPVYMYNTSNISFNNMTVNGSVQHGINGNNVNGLSISNTDLTNIGNQNKENGMHLINLLGTVSFSNVSVIGSNTRNVLIENNSSTAANITVTNSTFNTAGSEVGLDFLGLSSSDITFSVTDCSFTDNNAPQLKALSEDNSVIDATITGCDFDGNPALTGNSGIDLAAVDGGTLIFDVSGTLANPQTFQPFRSHAINIFTSGAGTASGRVNGNTINGSSLGAGIHVVSQVTDFNGEDPSIIIEIDGNNIDQIEGVGLAGIHIEARDGTSGLNGTATIDATVTNNTVRTTDTVFPPVGAADAAIQVYLNDLNHASTPQNQVCINAYGNLTEANGGTFGETDFFFGNDAVGGLDTGVGQMQGFATSVSNTWFNVNGNTTNTTPTPFALGLGPIGGGTCLTLP